MPGFYLPSMNDFDPSTDDFSLSVLSKERQYKHFDLPLREVERAQALNFLCEDKPHRFLPLLGFTDEVRRSVLNASGARELKIKKRPIRFAGHADAAYLEKYADHLNSYYERALAQDESAGSILAYRPRGRTNIYHAKALFDEIRSRGDCSVIALDISKFFDSLDHNLLRDEIAGLLGVTRLDGHHATVWKNVTRYSWVETVDLDSRLGRKRKRDGRVCSYKDFIDHVRGRKNGLIRTHDPTFGIPQGTPVSGLYANIYLRSFDHEMITLCRKYGGSYRRYSDDIAVVLPLGTELRDVDVVVKNMLANFNLSLSGDKTDTAYFNGGLSRAPIQYLGFTYNGLETLIRPSSLDAYRGKMRRGIHAKMIAAKAKSVPQSEVHKRECLSRYTHLGRRRNFLSYAYKAADIMDSQEIKQQVKDHMTWFKRTWSREGKKVFGE